MMNTITQMVTVENLTLLVGFLTLIVSILSYYYAHKVRKKEKKELIARKEAQLHSIEEKLRFGYEHIILEQYMYKRDELRAEIEVLKQGDS